MSARRPVAPAAPQILLLNQLLVFNGLHVLLSADDVFSEVSDPSWMARLSLPLTTDYHENVFVPNSPPSHESELLPREGLDSSSSFSTFGKIKEPFLFNSFMQSKRTFGVE